MNYRLIADSGSTKTDWLLLKENERVDRFTTQGINPFMLDKAEIVDILKEELIPKLAGREVFEINFYGAGCRKDQSLQVSEALREVVGSQVVSVASDMLGAARALCGTTEGIACILGTGSNSCLYDGENIIQNVSPLGFILGDEGSGAVLGRRLIGDVLKKQIPEVITKSFFETYAVSTDEIIRKVYRETFPNRYLASFCPFLHQHRKNEAVHQLLVSEFCRFFMRNVANYARKDLPVHFVGSIAYYFQEELHSAAEKTHFRLGCIKKAPLDEGPFS